MSVSTLSDGPSITQIDGCARPCRRVQQSGFVAACVYRIGSRQDDH
jgi:hypothetical protein